MMRRATAAAYCDLSEAEFEREVGAGNLPPPTSLGKSPHWNRATLDEHLDRMGAAGGDNWRATSSFYRKRNAA